MSPAQVTPATVAPLAVYFAMGPLVGWGAVVALRRGRVTVARRLAAILTALEMPGGALLVAAVHTGSWLIGAAGLLAVLSVVFGARTIRLSDEAEAADGIPRPA